MEALALSQASQPRRLRVGVFADSPLQPRWIVEALARLAAAGFAEVALAEARSAAQAKSDGAPALWRLYAGLDRRFFGAGDAPLDLREHLRAAPGSGELDVALALGALDDAPLAARARYGVWRFFFGALGEDEEAKAGAREVAREEPLTASGVMVRLAPDAPARLAARACSRTYPFSVARNRRHLHNTGELALRALRELHRAGPAWLRSCPPLAAEPAPPPLAGADALRIGARLLRRGAEKALGVEQWFLAFAFGVRVNAELRGFTRIVPPPDRDWADPFVLERDGRYFVFFEELPFAARKGHIAMIELRRDGRWSAPVRALERDYHLSYPFLFEHEGALYMIPESAESRAVELWRCVEFPARWRLERRLLEGARLVDATLHRSGARWWMFANRAAEGAEIFDDELCLFSAERLEGEWQPHEKNPVKSDPRGSRPAGRLFARDGVLCRPAQICVPRYGAGLAIQRVVRLSPHEYAEQTLERLVPDEASGLLGLHTLNGAGDLAVVDAFFRRRRFGR